MLMGNFVRRPKYYNGFIAYLVDGLTTATSAAKFASKVYYHTRHKRNLKEVFKILCLVLVTTESANIHLIFTANCT